MEPAYLLLSELQAIDPEPTMVSILMDNLWSDFLDGKINETCGGMTKKHRCILCCSLCRRGSKCCFQCHRCKYNDCSKHKTGRYGAGIKDNAGNYIIRPEKWMPLLQVTSPTDDSFFRSLFPN